MSFEYLWTISISYNFQGHQQRSQWRCWFSQTALLWFEVLPDLSPALPGLLSALPGAPRLVASAPSYSEGLQECPPRVWSSPEIDASKFTLHILSDTPGGFQWVKYILLMLVIERKTNIIPEIASGLGTIWSSAGRILLQASYLLQSCTDDSSSALEGCSSPFQKVLTAIEISCCPV